MHQGQLLFFPPIADPVLGQSFRDNLFEDPISHKGEPRGRDSWNMDELHGDKILSVTSTTLFRKYGIPYSWCAALIGAFYRHRIFTKSLPNRRTCVIIFSHAMERRYMQTPLRYTV
jgi:hypothetical protein